MIRKDFLPLARPYITDTEINSVIEVLKSGQLTTGPVVSAFENEVGSYIGRGIYCAALNSCTGGLYLGSLALGIGRGDEVILPTWTFAASGHVVFWAGARPVLCDVSPESLNIDVEKIGSLISRRTKGIMPVHFAGNPCNMEAILAIAKKYNLKVIEDAAHALGARYKGKKIGNFGDATVFSFYATKNLTCGEGGMVVSKNKQIIEKIKKLSYFGINKDAFLRYTKRGSWYYEIEELGYKYNMDSIHAAIGLAQLKKFGWMNQRRRQIAKTYRENLDSRISFLTDEPRHYHVYHLFPVQVDKKIIPRDKLVLELKERNIGTSVHFIPLHRHPFYKKFVSGRKFPVADSIFEKIVSIPMFPGMSDEDVFYVIDNINRILKKRG